jgi:PAS domain-containing protein
MTDRSQDGQDQDRRRSRVGRAWADLPLQAQGAVLHTVEVEREIAQVRILVQAGVTGYVLTGERRDLTSYEEARRELPQAVDNLGDLVKDNPAQAGRIERVRVLTRERATILAVLLGAAGGIAAVLPFTSGVTHRAAHLQGNAERLASGQPLAPALPGGDVLGELGRELERAAVNTPAFWVTKLHPGDRERFTDTLDRAVADRAPQLEQEFRFLLGDGYRWLYSVTRLVYDDDGELVDTLGYAMDVTERRQAEAAVRGREATLQAVVEASPDVLSILDAEGRVRSMSPAMERTTGYPAADAIGRDAFGPRPSTPTTWSRSPGPSARSCPGVASGRWCACASATSTATGSPWRRTAGPWLRSAAACWWSAATSPTRRPRTRSCARPSWPPSRPTRPRASTCRG